MKSLLRSSFLASGHDKEELLVKNYTLLREANLSFDSPLETAIWEYICSFYEKYYHLPDLVTTRAYFESTLQYELVDRLETVALADLKVGGAFIQHMNQKIDDRRRRMVAEILTDASTILTTGLTFKDGREEVLRRGPYEAINFILDKSRDVVAPTTGSKLSGDVTKDGDDFLNEYNRVKNDPMSGRGQQVGLAQMDEALGGAKRAELWTHAAFTGHGKCLAGDSTLWDLDTNQLVTLKELFEQQRKPLVHALNEKTWEMTTARVSHVVENGIKPLFNLSTNAGREIRATGNHLFMTASGWKPLEELKVGDWVAIPSKLPHTVETSPYTDAEISLLGYLLGDGNMEDIGFTNENSEIMGDFVKQLEVLGYTPAEGPGRQYGTRYRLRTGHLNRISISKSQQHSPMRNLLDRLKLRFCIAGDKFIPPELWQITNPQVWLLLAGLWSTDGCMSLVDRHREGRSDTTQATISYSSKSKELVIGIQRLLQRVGIPSSISPLTKTYKGEKRRYWFIQVITATGKRAFLKNIKIIGKQKTSDTMEALISDRRCEDSFPPELLKDFPDSFRIKTSKGGWHYAKWAKRKTFLMRGTVEEFALAKEDQDLLKKSRGNIRWEKVVSITPDGEEMTYDLCVPDHANFVANGFIVHNSTLMVNWAYNQAIAFQESSLIFSLEMPYAQVRRILFAMHSLHPKFRRPEVERQLGFPFKPIDYAGIRDGRLSPQEERILEFVARDFCDEDNAYGGIRIEVPDPEKTDFTIQDLKHRAEMWYAKDPFSTLFIDHMGLLAARKWVASTSERLNEVIRDTKRMAMSFNRGQGVPVVGLFQINREGYKAALKNEGLYNLTHLSYASECERSSDVVTASWLGDEMRQENKFQFQCLKSRDQQPFVPFEAKIEWAQRRLSTLLPHPNVPPGTTFGILEED